MLHFAVVCFMLIISWLFKSVSDKFLSVHDSFLICPLVHEKLSWDHLNSFLLGFWTTIKNGFVLDFIGLRNENAIMSRTTHQSNLLLKSAISSCYTSSSFLICKILSVSLHISLIFSKWSTHFHAQFLNIAVFILLINNCV